MRNEKHLFLTPHFTLIIRGADLEIGFGVLADRALFRGFFADNNMAAVGALPDLIAVPGEHKIALNI